MTEHQNLLIQKMMGNVEELETGCWQYANQKPLINGVNAYFRRKIYRVPRELYRVFVGKFKEGLLICHKCDNTACCNPWHIFPGTHQENLDDMANKGRAGMKVEWLIKARKEWLGRKHLTVRDVADATGLDYNTIVRWFEYGRTPRNLYLKAIIDKYPDWPTSRSKKR